MNPDISTDKYLHRQWTSLDGLPNNRVTAVCQDNRGFIWIGTIDGLARFDGNNFKVYNKINTDALKSNHITALIDVGNNTFWIGTDGGGLTMCKDNQFYYSSVVHRLPSPFIRSFSRTNVRRQIKIDTARGSVSVTPQQLGLRIIERLGPITTASNEVEQVLELRNLTGHPVHTFLKDRNRQMWAGTDGGLFRLTPRGRRSELNNGNYHVEKIAHIPGLAGDVPVTALFEDSQHRLWVGTGGKGLHCLRNPQFEFFTVENGLAHNFVKTVFQDREQNVWIGTSNGLNRYKDRRFTTFTTNHGLSGNNITAIFRDRGGDLWVGTSEGLDRIPNADFNSSIQSFSVKNGLPANTVQVIHEDRSGTLWFGTGDMGLIKYQDDKFIIPHQEDKKAITPGNTVYCFAEDNAARLWIGTQQGLFCIDLLTSRYKSFDNQKKMSGYIIRDIHMDWEKTLWLGTAGSGVICYSAGFVYTYPVLDEFASADIYRVCEDDTGILWITSGSGLFAFDKHNLDYYRYSFHARRRPPKSSYFRFLESDGLKSDVFNGGYQPAGWTMADHSMWFPTTGGIAVINPKLVKLEKKPRFPIIIEKVENRGEAVDLDNRKTPRFSDIENEISIYFTVLNYRGYENLQIKYRLLTVPLGARVQRGTVPAESGKIVLRDIKAKKYRLELKAGNDEKGWDNVPAYFRFDIKYTMPWADIALLFLIVLLAFSVLIVTKVTERRRSSRELMRIFKDDERYKTSGLNLKTFRMQVKQILKLMEDQKVYRDPNMSVTKMAEMLDLPKEHISQIINKQFYLNFNQFLNKYRIEEAKILLVDPKESQFVVLKIAHDVGFNSKSTFNNAFKKFTGMSPSQYRDQYGQQSGPKS